MHKHAGKSSKRFIDKNKIIKQLKPNKKLLDLGCGNGYLSIAASFVMDKVIALDIDKEVIKELNNKIKEKNINNIETIVADASKEIPTNNIDICLMVNVLHGFVENKEAKDVFQNILEVLTPDGHIIIVEFKKDSKQGPPDSVKLSKKQVKDILKDYNFRFKNKFRPDPIHYGLTFQKK